MECPNFHFHPYPGVYETGGRPLCLCRYSYREEDPCRPPSTAFFDEPRAAGEALRSLAGEKEIAFDLEADSLHSYREKVCLLQLSSVSKNLVIDPLSCGEALGALESLLTDPGLRKVIHGGDYDVLLLKKNFGFGIRNIFDTMVAAQFTMRPKVGLMRPCWRKSSVSSSTRSTSGPTGRRGPSPRSCSPTPPSTRPTSSRCKERLERDLAGLGRTLLGGRGVPPSRRYRARPPERALRPRRQGRPTSRPAAAGLSPATSSGDPRPSRSSSRTAPPSRSSRTRCSSPGSRAPLQTGGRSSIPAARLSGTSPSSPPPSWKPSAAPSLQGSVRCLRRRNMHISLGSRRRDWGSSRRLGPSWRRPSACPPAFS